MAAAYPRGAPTVGCIYDLGLLWAVAHHQTGRFDGLLSLAKAEGHLLAPEMSHAVKEAMDECWTGSDPGPHLL